MDEVLFAGFDDLVFEADGELETALDRRSSGCRNSPTTAA